ncbi:NHL repeat-containing protein [candidate division KSB1 bacterium]|nr:NHL repeat-containing protein [candidate division KSB1 bacterium]
MRKLVWVFWVGTVGCIISGVSVPLRAEGAAIRTRFLFSFGASGDAQANLSQPAGISVDPLGFVYVVDSGNHRLLKYDKNGKWLASAGGFGWGAEQFHRPMDVFSANGLDVFVADYENDRVERYDRNLNWILTIRSDQTLDEKLRFVFPRSLAVSLQGEIFVVDNEHRRVLKLDSRYAPTTSFADYDWGEGELLQPGQCALDREGRLYVCDIGNRAILVYDYFGNYLNRIVHPELQSPSGIALWQNRVIAVGDRASDRIYFFSSQGSFLSWFGGSGDKYGAFRNISDLAVWRDRLYISDTDNHRIQVMQIGYEEE